ncbi:MAG: DUF1559 domain-containing protein [Planctomycetota bacterium]
MTESSAFPTAANGPTSIPSAASTWRTVPLPTGQEHGFTLTELLVVITILAVLGAMAVPALRGALERADRTVCLSNLRQIGQAVTEYVADHGHYPAAEIEVTDTTGRVVERRRWYHSLAPYLGAPPGASSSGQGRAMIDPASGVASRSVLPSEDDAEQRVFPDVFRCPTVAHWPVGRNGAYGYNHQYLGDARVVDHGPAGEPRRRRYPVRSSEIADPAHTVVLMDSAGTGVAPYQPPSHLDAGALGNHSFTVDPPRIPALGSSGSGFAPVWASDSPVPGLGEPTLPSRPHARHRGGCCALFGDGRVEWLPLEVFVSDDALWNGTGQPSGQP